MLTPCFHIPTDVAFMMAFLPQGGKKPADIQCFDMQLISKHWLMSAAVETVSGAAHWLAYAEPPHFDGARREGS